MPGWIVLAEGGGGSSFFSIIVLVVLYFVVFWFILLRPQKRAEAKRQQELKALAKNDRVLTSGGVLGVVVQTKDDEVILRVDDKTGTRIHFHKSAIVRKLESKPETEAEPSPSDKDGAKAGK